MENKIKLLWISQYTPYVSNSHAGGKTFSYYYDYFANCGDFDVTLISICTKKDVSKAKQVIKERNFLVYTQDGFKEKIKKLSNVEYKINLFNKHAGLVSNYYAKKIINNLKKLKKENYAPKIIILEWTQMVVFAQEIKKLFPNAKLVASEHDVTFVGYERRANFYKGFKKLIWRIRSKNEKKIEIKSLKKCDLILPHNPDNIDVLKQYGIAENKLMWLTPYFDNLSSIKREPQKKDILFYGAMSRKENSLSALWFIDNVLPLIKDKDLRFVILGSNPPEELKAKESKNIHVTGFVDKIDPYFSTSMCFVAPLLLGAGIKVKIIEALSSGIPVLTNEIGIEGIHAKDKVDYFYCVTKEDYAKAIETIYNNDTNDCVSGREFIVNNYSLEFSRKKYQEKLKELVK